MQRRVFIAITLSDGPKKYIENKLHSFARRIEAKWVSRDEYYIALASLGYINNDKVSEACLLLRNELDQEEIFDVKLDSLKWGPNDSSRKMLWLQGDPNEQLIQLRNKIERALTKTDKEVGSFSPHITLVKFRKRELVEAEKVIVPSDINISVGIPVKSVDILESVFKNGKKVFQTLDSIELK